MAAKLQCEICGGKLIGKPGGIFECESCGTEYSTEWAKAKIQEIKGTVKVEGTVDVKGSVHVEGPVKVEGAANAQSLIKRGKLALEDKNWDDAKKYFDDALNAEPENAEAYLGKLMAEREFQNKEAFVAAYIDGQIMVEDKNLKRARQFEDEKLKKWFDEIDGKRKAEDEKRKAEEERKSAENKKRLSPIREKIAKYSSLVSAGYDHTVGLKSDGTVVAVGNNAYGRCNVQDWTDIVAVSAGFSHTVGLKSDGTVVATKYTDDQKYYYGQCNVQHWTDIVAVSAGYYHTVGLKSDGTVVAVGEKKYGLCDVEDWTDIVAVSAGYNCTVGLKSDGTVVAVGSNVDGQCDVQDWTDIVAVSAGSDHTVGLKSDGTVVATKYTGDQEYYHDQCDVEDWTDIVAVSAGFSHTVGLKSDGTVVAVGKKFHGKCNVQDWTDIVAVSAGEEHTVGLKSDGTVVATKGVYNWKLFKSEEEKEKDYNTACELEASEMESELKKAVELFESLKEYKDSIERVMACQAAFEKKKAERIKREWAEAERKRAEVVARREQERAKTIAQLNSEKTALQTELSNLKGLFTGKRRKEIEARLSQIETELKSL